MEPNAFGLWVSLQTYQSSGIHFVFWWIFRGRVSLRLWTTPSKLPKVSSNHMHTAFIIPGGFKCFCVFIPIWGNDPIWLIFFNWVETTNWIMDTMIRYVCFFRCTSLTELHVLKTGSPKRPKRWLILRDNPLLLPQGRMVQGTPVYDDTRHLVETSLSSWSQSVEFPTEMSCSFSISPRWPYVSVVMWKDVESKHDWKWLKTNWETMWGLKLCFRVPERSKV